jgi:hypothetical protein
LHPHDDGFKQRNPCFQVDRANGHTHMARGRQVRMTSCRSDGWLFKQLLLVGRNVTPKGTGKY